MLISPSVIEGPLLPGSSHLLSYSTLAKMTFVPLIPNVFGKYQCHYNMFMSQWWATGGTPDFVGHPLLVSFNVGPG